MATAQAPADLNLLRTEKGAEGWEGGTALTRSFLQGNLGPCAGRSQGARRGSGEGLEGSRSPERAPRQFSPTHGSPWAPAGQHALPHGLHFLPPRRWRARPASGASSLLPPPFQTGPRRTQESHDVGQEPPEAQAQLTATNITRPCTHTPAKLSFPFSPTTF